MRLIDADTLISALKNRSYKSTDWNDKTNKFNLPVVELKDAIMAVEEQPVIITGANELTLEECGSKWIPCTMIRIFKWHKWKRSHPIWKEE